MASQSPAKDDTLFAVPLSTGVLQLPGPTYESAQALLKTLRENYRENLIFHKDKDDDKKSHRNYSTHHALAVYTLGGSPEIIGDAYKTHDHLKPMVESPEMITEKNYSDHLGDERFYAGYLAYFYEYLLHHQPGDAMEHFVLSQSSNFTQNLDSINAQDRKKGGEGKKKHPEMLNRLLSGHAFPFVHIAYGWELGIPGQVAEGLAVAAVHPNEQSEIVPASIFTKTKELSGRSAGITSKIFPRRTAPVFHEKRTKFALLCLVRDDTKFANDVIGGPGAESRQYPAVLKTVGDEINLLVNKWCEEWLVGTHNEADIEKRLEGMVEEIIWSVVICFGIGGWQLRGEGQPLRADFSMMQLVTSAYFLLALVLPYSNVPYRPLSQASRLALLKAYTAMWVGRCVAHRESCKVLPIADFFKETRGELSAPTAAASVPFEARKALGARVGPWERIIMNSTAHPDVHVAGVTRALAAFAAQWGNHGAGYFGGGGDGGLEGRERLDGTLFVRVAGLLMDKLGWAYESGYEVGRWDDE